jgi:ribosome-binding factor A
MSKIRQQRTAEQIQIVLSELFLRELHDPRLQEVTITEVTIDRELEHADIYINALGDDSREADVLAALNHASGFLRHELAVRIRLRKAPLLHFNWDPRLAHMQEVEDILSTLEIPPPPADDKPTEEQ